MKDAAEALTQVGMALATTVQTDSDRLVKAGHVLRAYYPHTLAGPGTSVEVVVCSGPYDWTTNPGNGSQANPYQIQTASQLDSLVDRPDLWSKSFVLTGDIDLAGRTYTKALLGQDTDDAKDGFQGTPFVGSLDGRGFKIANLSIMPGTNDYLGLFGYIGETGQVTQLGLVATKIKGDLSQSSHVGSLAGYNAGTVSHCSCEDVSLVGRSPYVGLLVGRNQGKVEDCKNTTGGYSMGG
jgi:hypothetical protein